MGTFNSKIRLEIISALNDAGIKATAAELEKLQSSVQNAQASATGLGKSFTSAFNPMEAVMSVATGNINGMAKAAVQLGMAIKGVAVSVGTMTGIFGGIMIAVTAVKKLIDVFKESKEESEKASKAIAENFLKRSEEATKALTKEYTNQVKSIEDVCKKKNAELDVNQKLIESEIRLAKTKAGASKQEIEDAIAASRAKTDAAKAANEIAMGENVGSVRKKYLARAKGELDSITSRMGDREKNAARVIEGQRQSIIDRERAAFMADKRGNTGPGSANEQLWQMRLSSDGMQRRIDREMKKWTEANKSSIWGEDYDRLFTAGQAALENVRKIEKEIADAEEAKKNNDKLRLSAINLQTAEAIRVEKEERLKMQEELHRKRMEDLKTETAELSAAKSRFDKEFGLYNSGNAAQQIEAEKADEQARKQLQIDSRRYGGKWRIDELSRLYAEGDERKISETLSSWRKSAKFTPEVEAMVRAAAAGENVKTMEDRVAEIADNTKGLAEKVDELLSMKGE